MAQAPVSTHQMKVASSKTNNKGPFYIMVHEVVPCSLKTCI